MNATTNEKARLLDLTTSVLELVRDGKRNAESVSAVLQVIKDDPDFVAQLLTNLSGVYQIIVNYDQPSFQMIAAGNYDEIEENLPNFHFCSSGKKDVEITLLHFNRNFNSSDEIIKEMKMMEMRPAETAEILAFGASYPEIQRAFSIVALSRARGSLCFILSADQHKRRSLRMHSLVRDWGKGYRFAAVKLNMLDK